MLRALLLVCLVAPPAVAQVNSRFSSNLGASPSSLIYFRSYSSVDRLNIQYQNRTASYGQLMNNPLRWSTPGSTARAAGFRYYPNYPSLNSTQPGSGGSSFSAGKLMQPLPMTPLPAEYSCDPYQDADGCLSEMAGW